MADEEKGFLKMDPNDFDQRLELQLKEYDWAAKPARAVSLEELKQALAVLAVLDMDDDEDETVH